MRTIHEKGWNAKDLARQLDIADSQATSLLDLDVPASFSTLRQAFRKLKRQAVVVAGMLLVVLTIVGLCYSSPKTTLATANSRIPMEICNALRPFGASKKGLDGNPDPKAGYICQTPPLGADQTDWRKLSVTINSSPLDRTVFADAEIEGRYPRSVLGTATKVEMLWAASSVFTTLGMEIPSHVMEGIQHQTDAEAKVGEMHVRVNHACDEAARAADARCRILIQIRTPA